MNLNYELNDDIIVTSIVFIGDKVMYTVRYKNWVAKRSIELSGFRAIHTTPYASSSTKDTIDSLIFELEYMIPEGVDRDKFKDNLIKYGINLNK